MTELLKELEAVVGLCDKASVMMPGEDGNAAIAEAETAATNWVITHHAEIAEAVKDARRMDWLERNAINITLDGRLHRVMQIGTARDSIDDAMNNSARDDGE